MSWLTRILRRRSGTIVQSNSAITESFRIPEPTKSLLFFTNEDPANAKSPFSIHINISLSPDGARTEIEDNHDILAEPSLIWTRLPVRKNADLETQALYYPAYARLSPEQRYQYLSWLRDISQPTNLSYVFLYYYGLERHLLAGNYDGAVDEIFRLLKYHDKGTLRSYAQGALIATALFKKRVDIFDRHNFLFEGLSNETLLIRKLRGQDLTAEEVMSLANRVGFKNKRYLKLRPDDFKIELQKVMSIFRAEYCPILDVVPMDDMQRKETLIFANSSISKRTILVPQLLTDERLKSTIRNLLEKTHVALRATGTSRRG